MSTVTIPYGDYYVYRHLRPDMGIPFYIGIGRGRRWVYRIGRNSIWNRIVKKNNNVFIAELLFENISLDFAYKKEIEFIELYGRLDLNNGILANMTSGGDGGFDLSPLAKEKISKANSGKIRTDEAKLKMGKHRIGKLHTEETKNKISLSQCGIKNHMYGKKLSNKHIEILRLRHKNEGNPRYKGVISALNTYTLLVEQTFKNAEEIRVFLNKPNNYHLTNVYSVIRGDRKTAFGYKWSQKFLSSLT